MRQLARVIRVNGHDFSGNPQEEAMKGRRQNLVSYSLVASIFRLRSSLIFGYIISMDKPTLFIASSVEGLTVSQT